MNVISFAHRFLKALYWLILIVLAMPLFAQDDLPDLEQPIWLGAGIHGGFLFHSTDGTLRCLKDPACPTYNNGSGSSYGIHGIVEWKPGSWGLRSSVGLYFNNASFSVTDNNAFTKDQFGAVVPLVRTHSVDASMPQFTIDAALVNFHNQFKFFGGFALGYLLDATWTSSSTIESPGNVTFLSGRRDTVFLNDVSIPNNNKLQGNIILGAGYDIMLHSMMKVTPECVITIPLTSIVDNTSWKQTAIMAGISIAWGTGAEKEQFSRTEIIIDTIEIRDTKIVGNQYVKGEMSSTKTIEETKRSKTIIETIQRTDTLKIGNVPKLEPKPSIAVFSSIAGEKKTVSEIRVEGQLVTEGFPILPMVFFNDNSQTLPERYHQLQSVSEFSTDSIEPLVAIQHQNILNIIGERMVKHANAIIELEGKSDLKTENGDCALAQERANTVKNYLVDVWGISGERIVIDQKRRKCSPENPTMTQNEQGFAENRRVEMSSNEPAIFAPVIRTRYLQLTDFNPKEIVIDTKGTKSEDIESWNLSLKYKGKEFAFKRGINNNAMIPLTLSEDMVRPMYQGSKEEVQVSYVIKDIEGKTGSVTNVLSVKRDTTNFAIQRLSLMHFAVQQSTLNKQAENAISRFLQNLESDATMSIIGYSDNLGNAVSNLEISQDRANAVATFIRKIKPDATIVLKEGVGSTKLPPGIKSHDLPESRFLSRTVQIELIRRWKNGEDYGG